MNFDHVTQWHPGDPSESSFDCPRVVAAVQEYLLALESGKAISREEFVARHADIARELGACLDALHVVHAAALDLRTNVDMGAGDIASDTNQRPLGDFQILREIGRGGMGVVYEATQLSLGRRVALKVLPFVASLDPTRLQRFKNEAHAAAQLHHTNIVPVYAVGTERGVHFYAMQLIDGHALSTLIEEMRHATGASARVRRSNAALRSLAPDQNQQELAQQPRPQSSPATPPIAAGETSPPRSTLLTADRSNPQSYFRRVAVLIQQVAAALEHAHRFGVIHRDIKPANLILDDRGNIWITDFGLAQFPADVHLTRTGDMLGTLRYMSPEQAEGDRVVLDHRTDIYSLGVTLYELLTLEPMIGGDNRQSVLRQILDDDPRPPRIIDENIPVELETIVLKAIAKAPAERYSSAQQLADDLQRWLDDKPILARRPTLWERAARWKRRHRSLVTSGIVFLFLAILVLLASTIMITREHSKTMVAFQREIEQREAAEESFRQARKAVDTFLQLEEEELANRPSMHQVRRKFLETALDYYQSFLEQRHDDPSVKAELAATSQRVARIADEVKVLSGFPPLMLLSDSGVQEDLELPAQTGENIFQLLDQLSVDWQYAQGSSETRKPESRQRQLVELLRSYEASISEMLDEKQLRRLREIAWQQRRHIAFKYPEVAAVLGLTPEQRATINAIIEEDRPQGPPGPASDHAQRREDNPDEFRLHDKRLPPDRHGGQSLKRPPPPRENEERSIAKILSLLTGEQRAKWRDLTGEPFAHELQWAPDEWMLR